jgi:hypothetical protein
MDLRNSRFVRCRQSSCTRTLGGIEGGGSQISADAVSPITTYFRVSDGVRVRFADNKADPDIAVLLLVP